MLQNVIHSEQKSAARSALEDCPIGVAIVDARSQQRLFVNQALVEIMAAGLLNGDLRETWAELSELDRISQLFNEGGHLNNLEAERITLSGQTIWLLMNTQDIVFMDRPARLVWHVDITGRKEAEGAVLAGQEALNSRIAELRDREARLETQGASLVELADEQATMRMELQRLNHNKDKFFSIISHDLRSPFNALLGFTELLTNGAQTMKRKMLSDYSASVHEAAQQAFKLMDNLLHWSRLQMDRVSVELEVLDLGAVIQENIDMLAPIAARKDIALTHQTKQMVPASVDRDMMDTILRNLITNAIKFTPARGKITVLAAIHPGDAGDTCHILVQDTGLGAAPEQLDGLLGIYRKTTATGTAGEIGTGLGLPLCMELIEKLDGSLTLESAPGQGMTAKLTLPAAMPVEPELP
ncbi:MAG: HAMP domain-containing sensor histidine kinase [Alphaproteobacteria bacterium]